MVGEMGGRKAAVVRLLDDGWTWSEIIDYGDVAGRGVCWLAMRV